MTAPKAWRNKYGVYFIHDGDHHVKIGHAHDPSARLRELQTGNRRQFTLLAVAVGETQDMERSYHQRFARRRVSGEWFAMDGEIATEIERVQREYWNVGAPRVAGFRFGFGW
jgi:hypothetical protein